MLIFPLVQAKNYVQVTGIIRQELIDIAADDDGGELDPHGADRVRGYTHSLRRPDTYLTALHSVETRLEVRGNMLTRRWLS